MRLLKERPVASQQDINLEVPPNSWLQMKNLSLVAVMALAANVGLAQADELDNTTIEVFGGIEFPGGASSFADRVVSYEPSFGGGPIPIAQWREANQAIGIPRLPNSAGYFVSLGRGGRITLQFTDNALIGSDDNALDLHVFEIGPDAEDTFVEISKDGVNFIPVGKIFGGISSIDIDFYGFTSSDHFYYVRLTDDPNEGGASGKFVGADIDAVGAISTTIKEITVAPASCQLYAVNDQGLNNSQFFTVNLDDLTVSELGSMYKGHDVEALAVHPQTGKLFAASGKNTKIKGHLYQLSGKTGELTSIGSTGFKEIDGLSFHPDGTLWGWATGDGLVTIDTATGQASLVAAYSGEVEDLTWNTSGTILFGVENVQNNPDTGVKLLAYDGNTLTTVCEELTQSLEIEALDTLPDDTLLFGLHGKTSLPLGVIDVTSCQIVAEQEISINYDDVEGIAWPNNCQ